MRRARTAPRDLADLRLSPEEVKALARQGFVRLEHRDKGRPRYKLRFRVDNRQHVRCLGTDPAVAERIGQQLEYFQADVRLTTHPLAPHAKSSACCEDRGHLKAILAGSGLPHSQRRNPSLS